MNEQEVWTRFKKGSETDFAYLYRYYAPVLFRYGCKLSDDRDQIKDCLQQVFFNLWKGRENLSHPPSIKDYLLKALRNEVFKKLGKEDKNEALSPDYHFTVVSSYESELIEEQNHSRTKKKISDVLAKLPGRQREVIFLKYYSDLSYKEIGLIMGIEQESVYKLTYKAIDKLQRLLTKISAIIILLTTW